MNGLLTIVTIGALIYASYKYGEQRGRGEDWIHGTLEDTDVSSDESADDKPEDAA